MAAIGRVVQVNVSAGGIPKLPVEHARVGRYGLDGDGHNDRTEHGGPHRAVCLFGTEAIERLRSEGHPVEPGSVGENLTTAGVEWSRLPVGTRARIGDDLELELASPTTPCATQTANFSDGNFNRILIDRHPSDSRMYARVLHEGDVRAGDSIVVLEALPASRAADELLLKRLDRADTKSSAATWRAAREAGFGVDVLEDGELAMSSASTLPGPAFNQATGLARLPNLLSLATDFYDQHRTVGYLWLADDPWPQAEMRVKLDVLGGGAGDVERAAPPPGVSVRRLERDEAETYTGVQSDDAPPGGGLTSAAINPWPAVYRRLAASYGRHLFIAEIDGRPVARAALHISGKTGWLRGALTAPEARGRGIQRALISARVDAAIAAGCDLVGTMTEPDSVSARNLRRLGLRTLGQRRSYVYRPAGVQA